MHVTTEKYVEGLVQDWEKQLADTGSKPLSGTVDGCNYQYLSGSTQYLILWDGNSVITAEYSGAAERPNQYSFLMQLSEFLHSEDEEAQAVADLISAVRTYVPPNSSHVDKVSKKMDAIKLFTDTRNGNCDLSVDVDVIHRLIDEISQYQPE